MKRLRTKAFTLTELLVVVIVLGVLAAVAVPKFTRVLETRRTTEAESLMSAVRMEQEKRCTLGQNYTGNFSNIPSVAYARVSDGQAKTSNYTYTLTQTGVKAARPGKDYSLEISSYRDGEICCRGEGCSSLNKNYPVCGSAAVEDDECAATDMAEPEGPCDIDPSSCECNPNQEKCCEEGEKWDGSQCVAEEFCDQHPDDCTCNPDQEKCCEEDEEWNEETGKCEEKCVEEYGAAFSATSLSTDNCNGNRLGKYTCDGHFKGTCTDVYVNQLQVTAPGGGDLQISGQLAGGVATLASWVKDPFTNFKDSILLAQSSNAICAANGLGPACGDGCCPRGYVCNKENICIPGQPGEYDKLCQAGYVRDPVTGECKEVEWELGGVNEETPSKPTSIYMQRQVTCCGDGQTPVVPEEPDPEPSDSCDDPTYAQEHACECNPSTATCCTEEQIAGGMTYVKGSSSGALSFSGCRCPSGTRWNDAKKKCEKYEMEKKYTCYTSYNSRTIPSGVIDQGNGQPFGGTWRLTSYATTMVCGNETSHHSGTISNFSKGQEVDCTPGQEYLWYETWGYYPRYTNSNASTRATKYFYTCLKCGQVDDLSQCGSFTIPKPQGDGGSGSGGIYDIMPSNPEDALITP